MEKTSIPTGVGFKTSYVKDGKTKYVFLIAFANGDTGQYICDTELQDAFTAGIETTYELTEKDIGGYHNTYVRPKKPVGAYVPRAKGPVITNRQIALQSAVSLVVAGKLDIAILFRQAEHFLTFLNDDK